ncbi:MAG: YicC/YloC family endoribonuclease [Chthoniobacterales bacterium]
MHSMTGFGRGQIASASVKVVVEIQSVNKRQSEIILNLPARLSELEPDMRTMIDRRVHRGRLAVNVSAVFAKTSLHPVVNRDLAKAYLQSLRRLQQELKLSGDITIEAILHAPGVIETPQGTTLDPASRAAALAALDVALQKLLSMRAKEGANLLKDLMRRTRAVRQMLARIRKLQPQAARRYQAQLRERLQKLGLEISVDDDRMAKEIAYFAERSDFSEEVTRLESHLDQFAETSTKKEPIGRTLEFLSQEIGRELNTLSAKANSAEISQLVVHCKGALEKIREQIQNVE